MTLRLNRPQRLNALNPEMGARAGPRHAARSDDGSPRGGYNRGGKGVLRGRRPELAAGRAQAQGIAELEGLLVGRQGNLPGDCDDDKAGDCGVNGPAAGGGMNMALACDMRIASDQAKFAESFAKIGLYPDFGGTYFLPRMVGSALAAELFYTAETLTAEDAFRLGIVNRVFPADQFEGEIRKLAESLAAGAAAWRCATRSERFLPTTERPGRQARRGNSPPGSLLRIGGLRGRTERVF